jgi:hypothetical protein
VFSVGRRVFIHCPHEPQRGVALTDEAGRAVSQRLPDGLEVEIVAWRPRGSGGTRYRVRATAIEADGWVSAAEVRADLEPPPPAPPRDTDARSAEHADQVRKFGARR